jgi:hypothetical protein
MGKQRAGVILEERLAVLNDRVWIHEEARW